MRTITLLILLMGSPAMAGWNLAMTEYEGTVISNNTLLYVDLELHPCKEMLSYLTGWIVGKHEYEIRGFAEWNEGGAFDVSLWLPNTTKTVTFTCFEAHKGST